ncbi:hypothetical protein CIHG_01564 [Coccidioides immitis H538.4]|uniref:Uncharacterized protein n=3 Tax=Coccidioides immitis TaxID=5501 RepID=A0A0J8QSH6_COCIT|nr:hypothetical protein CIRG_01415 [Coccidioides immitis RMSCC 2394]KMU75441.1 hypothetical protein CISG_05076 [Coccidioides immitis RMSCC 3703]KMU83781.1 hypothetical protein CIHG_01564 [Coccidioides immitis H538.4]
MFAFVTIAKRTGAHTFNGIGKIRITAQSIAKLPGSGASVKLSTTPVLCRSLSGTCQRSTYVDENDPDSRYAINTERSEYSKSGTDNAVAAQSSAWDIKNQTPESAREESEKEWAREGRSKSFMVQARESRQKRARKWNLPHLKRGAIMKPRRSKCTVAVGSESLMRCCDVICCFI